MSESRAEQKEAINKVLDDAHARLKHDMEAAEATKGIPHPADFVKAARELAEKAAELFGDHPTNGNLLEISDALTAFRAAGGGE